MWGIVWGRSNLIYFNNILETIIIQEIYKIINGEFMASRQRFTVEGYAGVFYVEAPRATRKGMEKVYFIRYRKNGKLIEEKVGGQYKDNMTPAKASSIRGLRIEGSIPTNQERRDNIKQAKLTEQNSYSLTRIFSLFIEAKSENRSLGDDKTRFRLYVAPVIGKKTVAELATNDIEKIKKKMLKEGKSAQTIKHVLTLVKRLVNFAAKMGYVESIPATLHFDMPVVDNKVTENLTSEQMTTLLQVLDEEEDKIFASLIRLALFTGMRRGALLNLQWTDLDFERNIITLRRDVAKKKKTEYIPMNEKAKEILLAVPRTTSPYVFPGRNDNKPRANITDILKRVKEKAGLPENFRPLHGLRHSFASWLANSGQVSMYELQKLLTHSSPLMTQRYAHLHDEALKRASNLTTNLFTTNIISKDKE